MHLPKVVTTDVGIDLGSRDVRVPEHRLHGAEIRASGHAPARDIDAPLVKHRDFLSEHIRLDREQLVFELELAQEEDKRMAMAIGAGIMGVHERRPVASEMAWLIAGIEQLDSRLSLRSDFLLDRVDGRTARWQDQRDAVQTEIGIQRQLSVSLPATVVFEHPTVEALTAELWREEASDPVADLSEEGLAEVEAAGSDLPGSVHGVRANVADEDDVATLMAEAREKMGGLNVLVNNENIKDWELRFWQPSKTGKEAQFYTVQMLNASIAGIRGEMLNNKYPENMQHTEREHVSFCYQKIVWTWQDGGITAEDDWETPLSG